MVQHTFYIVSSIIMDGGIDKKTISEARDVAKKEAKRLEKSEYGHTTDDWVYIDKFNNITHKSVVVETFRWTGLKFIHRKGK